MNVTDQELKKIQNLLKAIRSKLAPFEDLMSLLQRVTVLVNAFAAAINENKSLLLQLAEAKQKTADALANDAADAAAIQAAKDEAAQAKAMADAAEVKVTTLQAVVDADATEDAQITSLIDSVIPVEVEEPQASTDSV